MDGGAASGESPAVRAALADLERDPYPVYELLRRHEPVHHVAELGLWFVTRWEDVHRVSTDHFHFTADMPGSVLTRTVGRHLMHTDGERHRLTRERVRTPFRPGNLVAFGEAVVSPLVDSLAADLALGTSAELIQDFAEPLAVRVLQRLIGLPPTTELGFRGWFAALASGGSNFELEPTRIEGAEAASQAIDDVVLPLIRRPQGLPPGSMLAAMVGNGMAEPEILANVKLTVLGGMQEPRDLVGLTLLALLTHPVALGTVLADLTRVKHAVEETLRWVSPVGSITREVREEVEIGGVRLPVGSQVAAILASANRDERRWKDPDSFFLERNEGPHLAFGIGPHVCIGAGLARLEAQLAVSRLLQVLPGIRLSPRDAVDVHGWEFRGPTRMLVEWDSGRIPGHRSQP